MYTVSDLIDLLISTGDIWLTTLVSGLFTRSAGQEKLLKEREVGGAGNVPVSCMICCMRRMVADIKKV